MVVTDFFCSSFLLGSNDYSTLVAVIMVKDEAAAIEATLQPFVDGGVDSFFVFDTGSTDNTIAIVNEFFIKNNIAHGYIEQEPFVDFAISRNKALERAQYLFPHASFMIMFDAEWYINNVQGLIDFCVLSLKRNDPYTSYLIRILNDTIDFYVPRLIRCKKNVQFEGAVHEIIRSQTRVMVPSNIYFEYLPTIKSMEKTKKRYIRDRELLYKDHIKKPHDSRTLLYLAMTCEALGNLEEAYDLYKQRIILTGFPEEDYISYYRLAQTIEKLSENNKNYLRNEAKKYYLQAHSMRQQRVEPLVGLVRYYLAENNKEKAQMYAERALEMPYPYDDLLFIERNVYDSLRYELYEKCKNA